LLIETTILDPSNITANVPMYAQFGIQQQGFTSSPPISEAFWVDSVKVGKYTNSKQRAAREATRPPATSP
jgi:hypothetical protein